MADRHLTTVEAGEDLTQYQAVKLDGSGKAVATTVKDDDVFGVVQSAADHAESDEKVTVQTAGDTKVLIDGSSTSLNQGDQLQPSPSSGPNGQLVSSTSGGSKVGEVIKHPDTLDGTSEGEVARIRLYNIDRSETYA